MSEHDQLREAIASELAMHYRNDGFTTAPIGCACGEEFDGFTKWRRHTADAVLAVLDQQGWHEGEPGEDEVIIATLRDLYEETLAERDAALREVERLRTWSADLAAAEFAGRDVIRQQGLALREAARYEPSGWCFGRSSSGLTTDPKPHYADSDCIKYGCVPLYRQVTEGGG